MKIDKLTYKIDGLEADFTDPEQIKVVTYLDEKVTEFRTTAATFMKALNMIYDREEKCRGK